MRKDSLYGYPYWRRMTALAKNDAQREAIDYLWETIPILVGFAGFSVVSDMVDPNLKKEKRLELFAELDFSKVDLKPLSYDDKRYAIWCASLNPFFLRAVRILSVFSRKEIQKNKTALIAYFMNCYHGIDLGSAINLYNYILGRRIEDILLCKPLSDIMEPPERKKYTEQLLEYWDVMKFKDSKRPVRTEEYFLRYFLLKYLVGNDFDGIQIQKITEILFSTDEDNKSFFPNYKLVIYPEDIVSTKKIIRAEQKKDYFRDMSEQDDITSLNGRNETLELSLDKQRHQFIATFPKK